MKINYIYIIVVIVIIFVYFIFSKDTFYNIKEEKRAEDDLFYRPHVYTSEVVPALKNNDIITKTELQNLFEVLIQTISENGPPGGANTNVDQNKYDLIFKDVIVCSEKRNTDKYPCPNSYSMDLNLNVNNIYKAELIEIYVPAATDDAVNIPVFGNRLYFQYTNAGLTTIGYVIIQAGTYQSPDSIAIELTRQFYIVLMSAGFVVSTYVGVNVAYDRDLNRYIFQDKDYNTNPVNLPTLIIYPTNDYVINANITVQDSIASYIMLNYEGPYIYSPYESGPKQIVNDNCNLVVDNAITYGEYTDPAVQQVALNVDDQFSNSIVSDLVLTHYKLYISLGKLNGNTCNIVSDQTPGNIVGNVPSVFAQIPNNSCVSSSSVKTLLGQPHMFSAIQFYNPLINKLNKLDIKWYSDDGKLVRILDHSFTLRVYYFQKRMPGTDFSIPIP